VLIPVEGRNAETCSKLITYGVSVQVIVMTETNNSILYYLCAESTALRPITDTAQCTYK
jgi:hypothetical protein